jgi:hypothetical protein
MPTISELISRCFTPEQKKVRHKPKIQTLSAPIRVKSKKPFAIYEAEVFNFLLAFKEALGIKKVMKFKAQRVDGAVELLDGKQLALEIKFRMNWEKACQAEWQFRRFVKRHGKDFPVDGGLVFFEEFSGDWKRKAGGRLLENGWSHWYMGHSEVDGLRLDLLRLCKEKLESFPILDAITAKIEKMTAEEANWLRGRLASQGD